MLFQFGGIDWENKEEAYVTIEDITRDMAQLKAVDYFNKLFGNEDWIFI